MYKYILENIDVNENSAEITKIYVNNEYVEKGKTICTFETTKVTIDIEAEESGYVEFLYSENDKVKFGEIVFVIKENAEESFESQSNKVEKFTENEDEITITKKAKEFMEKNNISINEVKENIKKEGAIKLRDVEELHKKNLNKKRPVSRCEVVNNRERVIILGAGTAGEVVADILLDNPRYEIVGFVDDNPRENFKFYGIEVVYNNVKEFPCKFDRSLYDAVIISFGGNLKSKNEIYNIYKNEGIRFVNAIHKTVVLSRNIKIGEGNVIGANAYIGTSTCIGNNNWIAANANLDHHNNVGNSNLFAPNFTSPGIVNIGSMNKFGANSSLSNHITIGDSNIVMNNMSVYKNLGNNEIIK